MKKLLILFWSVLLLAVGITYVNASVIIDPSTGGDYYFEWNDGLGQIDEIESSSSDVDWSITVAEDSYLDLVTAYDAFIEGDEFALVFNGTQVAWTNTYDDGSGHFHGEYDDLFLATGTHILTLEVTELAPGFTTGGAYASFSSTVAASPTPEPTTIVLFGFGLLGVAGMSRRRR